LKIKSEQQAGIMLPHFTNHNSQNNDRSAEENRKRLKQKKSSKHMVLLKSIKQQLSKKGLLKTDSSLSNAHVSGCSFEA